ncbi:MAG: DNA-binding protein [Halobacterium sp.]
MQSTANPGDGQAASPVVETSVRDGEDAAAVCAHCGRPFADADARALHVGETHEDVLSASEREEYEAAREAEDDALFYFHLRVVAALAVLYTVTVLLYMVALSSDFV